MLDFSNKTVIIIRTDSIGDVCLTLPICGYLKAKFKGIRIVFLGNTYTAPILNCSKDIDEVISWKELSEQVIDKQIQRIKKLDAFAIIHAFPKKEIARLMKKAGVPHRIGTSHRLFHLTTCNHRVNFTRKKAQEHESQLNFHLLKPCGLKYLPSLDEVTSYIHFETNHSIPSWLIEQSDSTKKRVVLHPKSQGSAVEWGVENFAKLGERLTAENYQVFYTGTEKEAESFRHLIPENCIDTTGKLTLDELIAFIQSIDVLVAASTGPLHIAGLLNRGAVGLFAPRRPIHPGRWMPLGKHSTTIVHDENCTTCASGKACDCISKIEVEKVFSVVRSIM